MSLGLREDDLSIRLQEPLDESGFVMILMPITILHISPTKIVGKFLAQLEQTYFLVVSDDERHG